MQKNSIENHPSAITGKSLNDKPVFVYEPRSAVLTAAEAPPPQTAAPAPAAPATPADASLASKMAVLRNCEAGGNYANKNNPKYRGAYQYDYSTWANYGGFHDPADAPPEVQDAKFMITYGARGASPWPHCGRVAGL